MKVRRQQHQEIIVYSPILYFYIYIYFKTLASFMKVFIFPSSLPDAFLMPSCSLFLGSGFSPPSDFLVLVPFHFPFPSRSLAIQSCPSHSLILWLSLLLRTQLVFFVVVSATHPSEWQSVLFYVHFRRLFSNFRFSYSSFAGFSHLPCISHSLFISSL